MPKNSQKIIESRRDQVWYLMLKGHNPQLIKKELNIPRTTVYRDIQFLTKKSKQYVFDMAKGLHALSYQRAIEGIGLSLSAAWDKFNDPRVPEKQKVSYLRLTNECNALMSQLTANGPSVMLLQDLTKRIERAGINIDVNGGSDFNPDFNDRRDTDTDKYIERKVVRTRNTSNNNNNSLLSISSNPAPEFLHSTIS